MPLTTKNAPWTRPCACIRQWHYVDATNVPAVIQARADSTDLGTPAQQALAEKGKP